MGNESLPAIHRRDAQLQHGRQRHPDEVRPLGKCDQGLVLPDRHGHPDERAPDDQDVHGGQRQVSHPELNRGEDQVGDEVTEAK